MINFVIISFALEICLKETSSCWDLMIWWYN